MSGARITRRGSDELAAAAVRAGAALPVRPLFGEVIRAIVRRRSPERVERLARRAAAAAWRRGLGDVAMAALDDLERQARASLELVEQARREFTRPPEDNRFAVHLVLCESLRAARETAVVRSALDAAEVSLRDEPVESRGAAALRHAGRIFALRGDVPPDELLDAVAYVAEALDFPGPDLDAPASRELARAVATEERRRAVRRASHDLRPAARRFPLFAQELERIVTSPPPDDPGADDVWVATVLGTLELC